MEPSHWWQRWSTPIRSANPFKPDLESLSPSFVRSEIGESTLTKTPCVNLGKSSNPFRSDEVGGPSLVKTPALPAAWKTTSPASSPTQAATLGPQPGGRSSNPFRSEDGSSILPQSSEFTATRKVSKPVKLPEDFDGKQPLKEYLMHFERCVIVNGSDGVKKRRQCS